MPNTLKYIAIHHSGTIGEALFVSSAHLTFADIEAAHKANWNFKSSLGFYSGYNFVIQADGQFRQCRALGEETAAQLGYNLTAASICLMGNFQLNPQGQPVDVPTLAQLTTMTSLLSQLTDGRAKFFETIPDTVLDFSIQEIHPHRYYQPARTCNGTYLPDSWARDKVVAFEYERLGLFKKLLMLYMTLLAKINQRSVASVGVVKSFVAAPLDRSCEGHI